MTVLLALAINGLYRLANQTSIHPQRRIAAMNPATCSVHCIQSPWCQHLNVHIWSTSSCSKELSDAFHPYSLHLVSFRTLSPQSTSSAVNSMLHLISLNPSLNLQYALPSRFVSQFFQWHLQVRPHMTLHSCTVPCRPRCMAQPERCCLGPCYRATHAGSKHPGVRCSSTRHGWWQEQPEHCSLHGPSKRRYAPFRLLLTFSVKHPGRPIHEYASRCYKLRC